MSSGDPPDGSAASASSHPVLLWGVATILGAYLLLVAGVAAWTIVMIFPESSTTVLNDSKAVVVQLQFQTPRVWGFDSAPTQEQGLILLAVLAGVLGSFLHAAQSLGAYVGDRQFHVRWTLWYVLRLPVGAVLGGLFYFVVRAGMLSINAGGVSPFGVVAIGALSGWFSKKASDKLKEVFENLFRTEKPAEFKDKLESGPVISKVTQSPETPPGSPPTELTLLVEGDHFQEEAYVRLEGERLVTQFLSSTRLTAFIPGDKRPGSKERRKVFVVNPPPWARVSPSFEFEFV